MHAHAQAQESFALAVGVNYGILTYICKLSAGHVNAHNQNVLLLP